MRKCIIVLAAVLSCVLPGCVAVSDIQVNAPDAVEASPVGLVEAPAGDAGMSAERLDLITRTSQRYVDEGKLAGVVTLVARDGKIVHFEAVGQRGADDDRPMTTDALFRIYSMSKPITAVAAMMLYEEGKFALSDPVEKFVPELADLAVLVEGELVPAEGTMTMRHLLTHTTGLSYGFNPRDPVDQKYREVQPLAGEDLDEFAKRLGTLPLAFEPGERWHYSVAVDVTGLVIQRISGMTFDAFLKERLFDPLGMEDTFFN
ncbi:MAG: beta-lactamase family protein, partial [Gammaproteobacteria bacterium]|nr:beta-lactamase family protein [Gammaproteobacteria bacterium]